MRQSIIQIIAAALAAIGHLFSPIITYFRRLKETRSRYYSKKRNKNGRTAPKQREKELDIVYPRDLDPDIDKIPVDHVLRGQEDPEAPKPAARRESEAARRSRERQLRTTRAAADRKPAARPIPARRVSGKRTPARRQPALLIIAIAVVFALAGLIAFAVVRSQNVYTLDIQITGEPAIALEYGTPYEDEGATASYRGSSIHKNDTDDVPVTTEISEQPSELGTYLIHYHASYEDLTASAVRVVHVVDTIPPELNLTTDPEAYTLPGQPYQEEGFTASDSHDGDLTAQVSSEERDGKVYYTVSDSSGNTTKKERAIVYDDRTAPVLTLNEVPTDIIVGDDWADSFTSIDDLDGDITAKVEVEGKVENYKEGTYTLKYKSTDEHGNESTAERTVTVGPLPKNDPSLAVNGENIVFLTFDDGPGEYTAKLLDILAKYDVKATFFVTGLGGQLDLIGREAEEGHTVGVHSLTHDYDKIYASEEAFWEDFDAMNDIIEQQTGSRTNIMRFPGGSSNTVSSGNEGIMTRLTVQAQKNGYDYYDWNAYDGDVYETSDPEQISENIIEGIQEQSISVVLCHDTKEYTVDGIEGAIRWALKNGYTFLPITFGCVECHHEVNN
ncbi:MAG: DUF5011 domain-containing protein [Eubacterium sp.]|nr:DUF5011 domain-containing protein [Eubacterium sp.]